MEFYFGITAILIMKVTAFIIGYKIVALGYSALEKGLKGEFNFTADVTKGGKLALVSASPGLLFVLLGSCVVAWALFVDKPVTYSREESRQAASAEPAERTATERTAAETAAEKKPVEKSPDDKSDGLTPAPMSEDKK